MKTISTVLALLLTVTLLGCGGKSETPAPSDTETAAPEPARSEPAPAPAPKPAAPAAAPEVVGAPKAAARPEQATRQPDAPSNTVAGPVEYMAAVVNIGSHQAYRIKWTQVQDAVRKYYALNTAYPKSLDDVVSAGLLQKLPSLDAGDIWALDAGNGNVFILRKIPNLTEVQKAVLKYHALNVKYPSNMNDLVEAGLLDKVPPLGKNEAWVIDSRTGRVSILRRSAN